MNDQHTLDWEELERLERQVFPCYPDSLTDAEGEYNNLTHGNDSLEVPSQSRQ
jgi:hypothetical protein